jgi:hypothetical protein
VVSTPASFSGRLGIRSRPGDPLFWLRLFVVFLSSSMRQFASVVPYGIPRHVSAIHVFLSSSRRSETVCQRLVLRHLDAFLCCIRCPLNAVGPIGVDLSVSFMPLRCYCMLCTESFVGVATIGVGFPASCRMEYRGTFLLRTWSFVGVVTIDVATLGVSSSASCRRASRSSPLLSVVFLYVSGI